MTAPLIQQRRPTALLTTANVRLLHSQQSNLELVRLMDTVKTDGGVVADTQGRVVAFWASFYYQRNNNGRGMEGQFASGIPIGTIADAAEALSHCPTAVTPGGNEAGGLVPPVRAMGADLETISVAQARKLGLSDAWTERLAANHNGAVL
eukprot:COSAG01_NODE_2426_length_7722_cov_2.700905_6_plen_150_part_00